MSDDRNLCPSKFEDLEMRRFGVSDFESIDDVNRAQQDMLRRLSDTSIKPRRYAGFADCEPDRCGRDTCKEACAFGTRRRRLDEIRSALRLLKATDGPICEVRLARASWTRPVGDLRKVSIAAAKQLNRRALDSLFNPGLVTVGTLKVFAYSLVDDRCWVTEIHQLVAGAKEADLTLAFSHGRGGDEYVDYVRVTQVDNLDLAQAMSDVLKRDLQSWPHPWEPQVVRVRPGKARRTEYYSWLLKLDVGDRMIRYGCDRYFNALNKRPRVQKPKIRKKRPYPYWLEGHMFGAHGEDCRCRGCEAWASGNWQDYPTRKRGVDTNPQTDFAAQSADEYYKE